MFLFRSSSQVPSSFKSKIVRDKKDKQVQSQNKTNAEQRLIRALEKAMAFCTSILHKFEGHYLWNYILLPDIKLVEQKIFCNEICLYLLKLNHNEMLNKFLENKMNIKGDL